MISLKSASMPEKQPRSIIHKMSQTEDVNQREVKERYECDIIEAEEGKHTHTFCCKVRWILPSFQGKFTDKVKCKRYEQFDLLEMGLCDHRCKDCKYVILKIMEADGTVVVWAWDDCLNESYKKLQSEGLI